MLSQNARDVVTEKVDRRCEAVMLKCKRLGLEVVVETLRLQTTTSILLPKELPSIEEAPYILAGALKAVVPGLGSETATNVTHYVGEDEPRVIVVKMAKASKRQ